MRFFEFKDVLKNTLIEADDEDSDDERLPSSDMTNANLTKTDRDGNRKYAKTIAASIQQGRTFTFRTKKTNKKLPEELRGAILRGTIENGEDVAAQLEILQKPAATIADVKLEDGTMVEIPVGNMVKDSVATGEVKVNLGNVAEAIMGSAMSAAFAKDGGTVTHNDVINIGKAIAATGKYSTVTPSKDKLDFAVTIPSADEKVFKKFVTEGSAGLKELEIDPKKIKTITKMVDDAVEYVNNSRNAKAAVAKAKDDPRENRVEVLSDGGNFEKQNTTKVDLEIMYDGTKINLISLKTGAVKQFGQVSGAEFSSLEEFFKSTIGFGLPQEMATKFKTGQGDAVRDYNYSQGPFEKAYKHIYKAIKSQVAGDNEHKEYDLVKSIYDGIKHHATRGEEGVILVVLSPSAKQAYQELQFGEPLLEALRGYNLDAKLVIDKNYKIIITGKAVTPEAAKVDKYDKLVQFRSYAQSNGIRNVVEMEGLLKDLADLQKIQAQTDAKPKPKATVEPQRIPEPQSKQPAAKTKQQPPKPQPAQAQEPAP